MGLISTKTYQQNKQNQKQTTKKTETKKTVTVTPRKSKKQNDIDAEIEKDVRNAVAWAKNNPYAYNWNELLETIGKTTKLTQNQYNNLKKAIRSDKETTQDIIKLLKPHKGIYKVLELQRFLTVKYDLFIDVFQCGTILNQVFGLKNADIWFEIEAAA